MNYRKWKKMEREERERLLEREKNIQREETIEKLEPEHTYLAVIRPRPKSEQLLDQIL